MENVKYKKSQINNCDFVAKEHVRNECKELGSDVPKCVPGIVEDLKEDDIAIIGMSLRLPNAATTAEYWSTIINGVDAVIPLPKSRWTKEQSCNPTKEHLKTEAGFLTVPIDEFDAEFFNISPMELSYMDPQQRLLLEVAWEAVEDAGLSAEDLIHGNVGCFTGSWTQEYRDLMVASGFRQHEFVRTYIGNSIGATSAKISHFLKLSGPNMATESGCSSSIMAVINACNALKARDCNAALACGVNLLLNPYSFHEIKGLLSPGQRCRAFDISGDGFVRSEGCVVMVLKRLSSALENEDKIFGVIRGHAYAQEGSSRSIGTPSVKGEASAMSKALKNSGVSAENIQFIEAHGTGTAVGDPTELEAIKIAYSTPKRETPLIVGSVKANIGHTESCCGLASIAKLLLVFQNEIIPRNINIGVINPQLPLLQIPAEIPLTEISWPKTLEKSRIAAVHSFGITGTYGSLIIQEAPQRLQVSDSLITGLPAHLVCISAKTPVSFQRLQSAFVKCIGSNPSLQLEDIAFTANACRHHFPLRMSVSCSSASDLLQKLKKEKPVPQFLNGKRKICFVYSGIGINSYSKMGKEFYKYSPIFAAEFDKCGDIVKNITGLTLKDMAWRGKGEADIVPNTALFVMQYCLTKLLLSIGVQPSYVLGLSFGEYLAAVFAGLISLEDGVRLTVAMVRCVHKSPSGSMALICCSESTAAKLIELYLLGRDDEWIDIAAVNSPHKVTVSSTGVTLEKFIFFIRTKEGIDGVQLDYPHSLHSRSLNTVYPEMIKEAEKAVLSPGKWEGPTYLSSSEGDAIYVADAKFWANVPRKTIKSLNAIQHCGENVAPLIVEVGPSSILLQEETETPSVHLMPNKPGMEWESFVEGLGRLYVEGVDINWRSYYASIKKKKVSLPFYQFDRSRYWFPTQTLPTILGQDSYSTVSHLLSTSKAIPDGAFICESFLEKSHPDLEYFSGHKIMEREVFPGAGFLELVLATVRESGLESQYLTISNFQIRSPLDWSRSEFHKFYVSYNKKDSTVSVYHSTKKSGSWDLKANADVKEDNTSSEVDPNLNWQEFLKTFVTVETLGFYEKLYETGYTFDNSFRSIESVFIGPDFVVCKLKIPKGFESNACLHPLVGDAMLQTPFLLSVGESFPFQLPSAIGEVSIFKSIMGKRLYTYCSAKEPSNVFLYNENEELLVKMKSIDFVKSSPQKLLNAFDQEVETVVPILIESWVKSENFSTTSALKGVRFGDLVKCEYQPARKQEYIRLNKAIGLKLLKAFISLGIMNLKPSLTSKEILRNLNIASPFHRMFIRLLDILEEDGFVHVVNSRSVSTVKRYTFREDFLPAFNLKENLIKPLDDDQEFCNEWMIASLTLEKAEYILRGELSPLAILFPESSESYSAEKFYYNSSVTGSGQKLLSQALKSVVAVITAKENRDYCISICEVGAGTGSTTSLVLEILKEAGVQFTYTFTDVSPSFFLKAKEKFGSGKEMSYKILDLESDVLNQGFLPWTYDIVIGANVLHATKNLVETCSNIFKILKNGGMILGLEMFQKMRWADVTFGMLDGFWRFSDTDIRSEYCLAPTQAWENVLVKSGFEDIEFFNDEAVNCGIFVGKSSKNSLQKSCKLGGKEWICVGEAGFFRESIVKELKFIDTHCVELEGRDVSQNFNNNIITDGNIAGVILLFDGANIAREDPLSVSCQVLDCFKDLIFPQKDNDITVLLVCRGAAAITPTDNVNPNGLLLLGMARTLQVECPLLNVKVLDLDINSESNSDFDTTAVIREMWNSEHCCVSIRNSQRYVQELNTFQAERKADRHCQAHRYHLKIPESRLISDVEIVPLSQDLDREVGRDEVEIQVKVHGLNFREILSILKPSAEFENVQETVGLDVAGIVSRIGDSVSKLKVGDRVFGFVRDGLPLSSHTLIPEHDVLHIPQKMPFEIAATLPVAFVTGHHSLVEMAMVKAGETVLVHTASGAVGLMCLQICKKIGANVIATAGNNTKRLFLKNYGVKAVANSRTLEFKEVVSKATNGLGVDVVINTLTGPGFKEASLASCKIGGRFIELSKLNIWTTEELKALRPDISYTVVDFSTNYSLRASNMCALESYIQNGWLSPIPRTRFDVSEIAKALQHLERASHIGKVVCVAGVDHPLSKRSLFAKEATYVVTGGTRGVGLATAGWMLEQGAQNILLCSRFPPSEDSLELISSWREQGYNVFTKQGDVSLKGDCESILTFIKREENLPPLRGIFHAAGCILDNPIIEQDKNSFLTVFKPKVYGTLNLHSVCAEANLLLDYFVVFSSFGGFLGYPGQCNYVIANNYMDSLIHKRNSIGLAGTSVQWGHWNETGVVAGKAIYGIKPMMNRAAFQAFETILRNRVIKSAAVMYEEKVIFSLFPWLSQILSKQEKLCQEEKSNDGTTNNKSEEYKDRLENAKTKEEIEELIQNIVRDNFYIILQLPANKRLKSENELIDYGLDSLMAIELRNRVQHQIGNKVQILTSFFTDSQSLNEATGKIVEAYCA